MKKNKKKLISIILSLFMLVFLLFFNTEVLSLLNLNSDIGITKIRLNKNVVLLDSANMKIELSDLNIQDVSLFFWFSNKCCHTCVESEVNIIQSSGISSLVDVNYIIAITPIRVWADNYVIIKRDYKIENNLYCMYSQYSFIEEENIPYYFLYDKKRNIVSELFIPNKDNPARTFEYLNKLKSLENCN